MKNLLITGNVISLAAHLCQRLSRQYHMVLAANQTPPIAFGKGVDVLALSDSKTLEHVFQAYSFQSMIFLSTRGEQQSRLSGEADLLSSALALAKRHGVDRVLCLTSGELSRPSEAASERGVLLQAMEQLCTAYRRQGVDVSIVRLPCVFGSGETDTLIGRMLTAAARGETAVLPFARDAQIDFISAAEVAQLVYRLLERDGQPDELLMVRGAETLTVRELTALFGLLGASVSQGTLESGYPPMEGGDFRRRFGFTPSERLSVALDSLYVGIKTSLEKQDAQCGRVRSFLSRHSALVKGASLLLGYGAMEALQMLQDTGRFPALDLRLLYVALMGAAHGLQTGLLAVVFASFSIARGYGAQGMDIFALLHDWKVWVPFAALILTGSITGCAHDKGRKEARSAQETVLTLEKRCSFLQDLYKQSLLSAEQATPSSGQKQERLEEQLAQLRQGQERLEQEWLTLLQREQARWDRERAEKGSMEETGRPVQNRDEETEHPKPPVQGRPPLPNPEKALAAEMAKPGFDAVHKMPQQAPDDGNGPAMRLRPAAEPVIFPDDGKDDDLSLPPAQEELSPLDKGNVSKGADNRFKKQEDLLPNWADPSSEKDRVITTGSPFGKLSPSERRRMLEAMQVRPRPNQGGKPKRKR